MWQFSIVSLDSTFRRKVYYFNNSDLSKSVARRKYDPHIKRIAKQLENMTDIHSYLCSVQDTLDETLYQQEALVSMIYAIHQLSVKFNSFSSFHSNDDGNHWWEMMYSLHANPFQYLAENNNEMYTSPFDFLWMWNSLDSVVFKVWWRILSH